MHQIISTIKERSFFIIFLMFLLNISCEQNRQTKLKQEQPKITQNRFNADLEKVDDFDDLTRHLNQYDSIWRKIIPSTKDFDYVKDMASELSRIQNKGALGNVSEDLISGTIRYIPKEGGLREVFLDMWLESQGKSMTKK